MPRYTIMNYTRMENIYQSVISFDSDAETIEEAIEDFDSWYIIREDHYDHCNTIDNPKILDQFNLDTQTSSAIDFKGWATKKEDMQFALDELKTEQERKTLPRKKK